MKFSKIMIITLIITPSISIMCPTCVARIQKESPAFFNDDFYTKTATPPAEEIDEAIDTQTEDKE